MNYLNISKSLNAINTANAIKFLCYAKHNLVSCMAPLTVESCNLKFGVNYHHFKSIKF